jgi:Ca2+-binding RTX toxin-like protein
MATKSSTRIKSTLQGTSVADVLTVKHDQVTVTGAGGNDTIKITKGNSSKVNGDAGKDTITVSAGKSHTIHGNAANDTITIGKSAGTGIKAYGDAGNDTIKATNSYAVTFYGGDGSDTLTGGKGADKLYGDAGADKLYGGAGNDTLSGGAGDDKLYGQAGTDTLTGGAGKDTFVYASGGGSDKITDYAAGYDTLQISSGSISKTTLANSSKDMVITVGTGKVTLKNAAGKSISMKDTRGSYTMSKSAITLGSNFTGTMDSAKYLSTVTTINGKSSSKTVTIKGNAKANTIYGGSGVNTIYGNAGNDKLYGYAGNDTLSGGDGNDTLYGGAGTDALTGGTGKDTFVYANGDGSDTIKDYAAGQDTLYISSGSISKASLANSNKDLVFTVGSGKVTLTNAATKAISLKDSRGNYTASNTAITLGSDFSGTMDATKYLASVTTIDGRNTAKAVNITGNAQDNIIYAGKAGGTISGGAGNDTLYGGAGNDTFVYAGGKETIYNYVSGSDTIKLSSTTLKSTSVSGEDTILNLANCGTIAVKNAVNVDVLVVDSTGKSLTINNANAGDGSTVYGSDGADTFVYNANEGNATIKDYKEGEDILQIADGEITKTEIVDGNVVLTVGDEGNTITLDGAAGKSIEIHNSNGSLILSEDEISLGSDYTGDIDANAYLPTVTTIDGRSAESSVNITGNTQNNTIYAGIVGGTINGGAGDDVLYGGEGNDTFVYANGSGNDIINDYTEGQDTIKILDGIINKVEFDYSACNVVLTVGEGTVTIEGAYKKTISLQDSRGSFTASMDWGIVKLGSDFEGTISGNDFIAKDLVLRQTSTGASWVTEYYSNMYLFDGRDAEKTVNIDGGGYNNRKDNIVYAGKSGGVYSGNGNAENGNRFNTLYGGAGSDTFKHISGSTIIYDYDYDKDIISLSGWQVNNINFVDNNDVRLVATGISSPVSSSVTVKEVKKGIKFIDYNGLSDIEMTVGSQDDDVITCDDADNYTVLGLEGNDTLYGGAGNDTLVGGEGEDIIYGGSGYDTVYGGDGDDTLHGGIGEDTLIGGAGKNTFIYVNGDGNDTITDFNSGQDTLQITSGTISKTERANSNQDLVFTIGNGTVTLKDAASKTIKVKESRGNYTLSGITSIDGPTITLDPDYTGTMDATGLSIFETISASNLEGIVNITGNALDNIIWAGKSGGTYKGGLGNDTLHGSLGEDILYGDEGDDILQGYMGNDTLYGGEGNDTLYGNSSYACEADDDILYGGDGKDTFVIDGEGNDIIKDYTEGQDTVEIEYYAHISNVALAKNRRDLIITVNNNTGEGTVTLTNAAGKTISFKTGSQNSYTVSDTTITLGEEYYGTMDANAYLSTITTIDCRNDVLNSVNIIGNAQDNIIYAGVCGGSFDGGAGNDTLYGSDGVDTFVFSVNSGNDTVNNFTSGQDVIKVEKGDFLGGITCGEWLFTPSRYEHLIEFRIGDSEASFVISDSVNTLDYINPSGEKQTLNVIHQPTSSYDTNGRTNTYRGGITNDMIVGARGNDEIFGGAGNDYLYGGPSSGAGLYSDKLHGENGNDVLCGYGYLYGDAGNDTLYGSGYLYGGEGNDTLWADYWDGNNLYGEGGEDIFVFSKISKARSFIMDYETGKDIIRFNNVGVDSSSISGDDVYLNLSNGGKVQVLGAAGKNITFDYGDGNLKTEVFG